MDTMEYEWKYVMNGFNAMTANYYGLESALIIECLKYHDPEEKNKFSFKRLCNQLAYMRLGTIKRWIKYLKFLGILQIERRGNSYFYNINLEKIYEVHHKAPIGVHQL